MALNKPQSWRFHRRVPMNKLLTGRLAFFSLFVILALMDTSYGQTGLIPNSGATSPLQNRLTLQSEGTNAAFTVHRNNFGKPCLHIEAASRRHVINPHIFDHVISVLNNCPKNIQLRVCYYKSDHCIDMEIPGSKRKDGVLGVFPGMQYFRYSYREKL